MIKSVDCKEPCCKFTYLVIDSNDPSYIFAFLKPLLSVCFCSFEHFYIYFTNVFCVSLKSITIKLIVKVYTRVNIIKSTAS